MAFIRSGLPKTRSAGQSCRRSRPVAAGTSRIRLGLGILNPYQHHPTLIAQEAAALDELSGGRVRLGIGSGIAQRIAQLGTRYRPLAALADAVQIVRALLRHETVTYRGRAFSADRVVLEFAAPRPDMPIHLAAMADRSLALCGRLADGLIVSNLCPPAYTARAVAIVRESAATAGREPLDIVQYLPCAARPDGAEAREIAKVRCGWRKTDSGRPLPQRDLPRAEAAVCPSVAT